MTDTPTFLAHHKTSVYTANTAVTLQRNITYSSIASSEARAKKRAWCNTRGVAVHGRGLPRRGPGPAKLDHESPRSNLDTLSHRDL